VSAADTDLQALPVASDLGTRLLRSIPWLRKAVTAITDQGLTAGSNFVLGVLLARWLRPEQYGAYSLAYSLYLLLGSLHQALLLEPLNVLGPSLYHDRLKPYIGRVLALQFIVGIVTMGTMAIAGIACHLTGHPDLAGSFFGLTIADPCIFLLSLARSACYVEMAPGRAAAGSVLYCAVMLAGMWIAFQHGAISPFSVFVLMGVSALVGSAVRFAQVKPQWRDSSGLTLREVWREHWAYGRWALGSAMVNWIPGNIFYSVTGALLGMRDAGAFRGLMNLTLPVAHTASAISMLVLPYLARIFGRQGIAATNDPVKRFTGLYALGAVAYGAIFLFGHDTLFRMLYAGKFMEYSHLVPWVLVGVVFQVASYGPCYGLRAVQQPAAVLYAYAVSAAVSLAIGIPATWAFGLAGAVGGTALATLACYLSAAILFRGKLGVRPSVCREEVVL
jgi:O-antigen/teichoic acid export membrane protein